MKRIWLEAGFVLALPPVLFFLYDAAPIFQNGYIDPYVYAGYLNNFEDLYARFGLTYYSVRFGYILPGMALSALFGPEIGYFALVYLLYLISGGPLYLAFRKHFSAERAAIALAVFVSSVWLARAQLWQYVDGATASYLVAAIAIILLDPQRKRPLAYVLVGVFFSLAVNTNFFAGALVSLAAFPYLVVNRGHLRSAVPRDLAAASIGFLGTFGLATLFYWVTIGEWNLLRPTLGVVTWSIHGGSNVYRIAGWEWLLGAPWVFYPIFVFAALLATLRWQSLPGSLPAALLLYCVASLVFFAWFHTIVPVLELFFYFSMLIPAVLMTAAAVPVMASAAARLSSASNWACVGIVVAAPLIWQLARDVAGHASLVSVLALTAVALFGLFISVRIGKAVVASCALFAVASHAMFVVIPGERGTLKAGAYFDLVYGGNARQEIDVFRIAIKLIAAIPKRVEDDKTLWFWYRSASKAELFATLHEPALDSLQSTFLSDYSRLHESGSGRSMPSLGMPEQARLSAGEPANLALLGAKVEDVEDGTHALARAGILFNRRADERLCSGDLCIALRLLEITPKRAKLADHPYGGLWERLFEIADKEISGRLSVFRYGIFGSKAAIAERRDAYIFQSTGRDDHLASDYFDLPPPATEHNYVRIVSRVVAKEPHGVRNCRILIQDQSFKSLARLPCADIEHDGAKDMVSMIRVDPEVRRVRVVIMSSNGKPTALPRSLKLEYARPG